MFLYLDIRIPELFDVIGSASAADLSLVSDDSECVAIKAAYEKLMRTDEKLLSDKVNQLHQRLEAGSQLDLTLPASSKVDLNILRKVFIRLCDQYPGDCGCFSLFFLNYICLEPGQAVFLDANLPHAYLSGDCVECMACSDNVVRAGLTPKFKDVDCLLSMLQYEPRTSNRIIFPSKICPVHVPDPKLDLNPNSAPEVSVYEPPVQEFAVDRIWVSCCGHMGFLVIPANCEAFHLYAIRSASILIVITGSGRFEVFQFHQPADPVSDQQTKKISSSDSSEQSHVVYAGSVNQLIDFHRGTVFFVHENVSFSILPDAASDEGILAFRAYANVDMAQSESTA
ncbi:Mannose-6-phosphate isomerase [Fasciolopsis buskii]|uniref:Mannose-6-phosphate isomerase n=1 Tax=Fasciolopsis buskii TaxID=27845 RepID=A0A8E0VJA0_9TREM|nr:Mannose-6-phosphate isomerase [Fasciolopsis buski]